jgi:hypothetical protein
MTMTDQNSSKFTKISQNDFWQSILNQEFIDIIELEYDNLLAIKYLLRSIHIREQKCI